MNSENEHQYSFWVKVAARTSFVVAVVLVLIKLYAWFVSGAASMLASATDSLLDLFASGLNLLILIYALKPADKEHRFGHGKAESLAGIAQAAFINGSALLLIFHGIERVLYPVAIEKTDVAVTVTLVSLALTIGLVLLQKVVISKTKSVIVQADSLHYQSDILLNLAVLAALLLSNYLWAQADGLFTILVGAYLCFGTKEIVKQSLDQLLDRELSAEDIAIAQEIIAKHRQVLGFHQLRTRQSGPRKFVQLHLELPNELSLLEAHHIADDIERQISQALSPCEVIIHQDPSAVVAKELRDEVD
ncbi:cation diffusion facilitator family transporter [Thalassotalea sp. M1531]|uniref:Cation diffusion facilitator family transporter n=1 Tax=Thalassotalea algicola TaxID=2716224 RepID=A0A7Y0LA83_9GAMM|nr:cation diffusion facilitator family transporter [Thalassotalea algicola]NMP30524.1 cation diffusion facilitator family transporter [Thalassotalea algicola]